MSRSVPGRRFRDAAGNVTTMYALLAPILVFATGAAIDYGRAAQMHSKLNAAADAAALAALTPNMLQQTSAVAQSAATSLFQGLTNGLPSLSGTTVVVTVTPGSNQLVRNVTVKYSTQVPTIFAAVLGRSSLPVQGSAQATAQIPPNIDFYVLLDNSPSMALPATAAGITQMQSLTAKQDSGNGCAFACHQASTNTPTAPAIPAPTEPRRPRAAISTAPPLTVRNWTIMRWRERRASAFGSTN
jgi:Flp pilus assembly protein TadG